MAIEQIDEEFVIMHYGGALDYYDHNSKFRKGDIKKVSIYNPHAEEVGSAVW